MNFSKSPLLTLSLFIGCFFFSNCNDKPQNAQQVSTDESQTTTTMNQEPNTTKKPTILFFGDSLTAGYGLDEEDSFPSLIQDRIDSLGYDYKVVNAGLSGETTAGGAGRIDWVLQQAVDVFVLELGANDMLRGLSVTETVKNLETIVTTVKSKYPESKLIMAGMQAAPNMGKDYVTKFNNAYAELAEKYDMGLIPFLLDGVAGDPSLNLPDGKHPNKIGQKIVLENVWSVLSDYLKK